MVQVVISMEELIKKLIGKKVDVSCGSGAMLRGEVLEVANGILYLRDEDEKSAYVAVDKIATVYECSDSASRPGFIG
jgi:hypothetical protein